MSTIICHSFACEFLVGGREGWVHNPSDSYSQWAKRMRFHVHNNTLANYFTNSAFSIIKFPHFSPWVWLKSFCLCFEFVVFRYKKGEGESLLVVTKEDYYQTHYESSKMGILSSSLTGLDHSSSSLESWGVVRWDISWLLL